MLRFLVIFVWVASSSAIAKDPSPDQSKVSAAPDPPQDRPGAAKVAPIAAVVSAPDPLIDEAKAEVRDEDLLLMSVDLDGLTVTDALPCYGSPDDPLVPLGALARLLDLDITVFPPEGTVTGRLGQAQRALTIDLASGVARLDGQNMGLLASDFVVTGADIYFRASVLERVLRIAITVDVEALQLRLTAQEKLPVQARLERISQLNALRPEDESTQQALRIDSPYALFSPPAFDVSLQAGINALPPRLPRGYDVRIGGDLLYTGFQGFVSSDQNGDLTSVRATFERNDVKGRLLGPIRATSVSAGDIYTPALVLGPRSIGGRGFVFGNTPLLQTSVFSRIDLRGDLPTGYDIQLFINDTLRGGQQTPVQGRYEFLSVPLQRGLNVIRIVLNGPTGQRSEQTRIVNVGGGQLKSGAFTFSAGVAQQDTPLIVVQKRTADLGLSPGEGRIRASLNTAYGLSEAVTIVGGAGLYAPTTDGERAILTTGARASIFGAAVQMDAASDNKGGAALGLGLAAQRFGISALLRHTEYRGGFIDEAVGSGTDTRVLVRNSQLNVDFSARLFKGFVLPISLNGTREVFADRSSNLTANVRTSATVKSILLSAGLDFQSSATPASMPDALPGASTSTSTTSLMTGNLSASTFYDFKWQLRASANYNVLPKFALGDISFTADRDLSKTAALRLGLGHSFVSKDATAQVGFIKRTPYGDLALTGNYTYPSKTFQIGVTLAFGIVFDPYRRRYALTRSGPGTGGSVAFQTFMDANADGIYGTGDRPVANVSLDGGERPVITGADGRVFVSGFGSSHTRQVQVGLDDIEAPYVNSPPRTVIFAPRPGLVVKVPFPLTASSEIITRIVLNQGEQMVGLSAVRVRLVPESGPPLEMSTEYDGSAVFEQIGPGSYDFQLDPVQAERLRMRLKAPVKLVVPAAGGALPDLTVEVVFEKP